MFNEADVESGLKNQSLKPMLLKAGSQNSNVSMAGRHVTDVPSHSHTSSAGVQGGVHQCSMPQALLITLMDRKFGNQ